jgi:hypothetical protein
MADAKKSGESAEAAVLEVPDEYPDKDVGQDPQSGRPTLKVSASDMPDAEPFHTIAEKSDVFDPNAALRGKMGIGPGLQDSEAKNPAVWNDIDSDKAREAAAKKIEQDAQRAADRAEARAKAIRAGEPDPYPNG